MAVLAAEAEDGFGFKDQLWAEGGGGRVGPGKFFVSFNATKSDFVHKRAYSLSVSPASGPAGSSFTATYSADDVTSSFIGIFASGSSSTSNFHYVTANRGSITFTTTGLAAGTYNVYLVISTGYVQASAKYTVTSGGTTTGGTTTGGDAPAAGDPTTWLNAHNAKRSQYGISNLVWSSRLQTSAQYYANILASGCTFAHSGGDYGENLAMGYTSIQNVLNAWVDSEAAYYNPSSKTCSGGVCGHFTQVLWRMTSHVGCGIARCANGSPIYVCQYLRPGNCNGYDYQSTSSPCGPFP